ncbi:MAG: 50S ribosomal protein L11 methyltransferase [Flavobacteriales bacterium]|nr:50S ribosomal protein L11 methyltransferase [Flavobacteriales bacterium]
MNPYVEVEFVLAPMEPWRDLLVADLGEVGFEAFEDTVGGLRAYIPEAQFRAEAMRDLATMRDPAVQVSWKHRTIPARNWNLEWEQSFAPVEVDGRVRIRAAFHPSAPGFQHELVITPRMAFGTGHHATTRMMVEAMLGLDLGGQHVCDLGCGTGVLAILAERLGASAVHAIDIDEAAVENTRDNAVHNACHRIVVEKGDAGHLKPLSYGTILANIERNTLLRGMQAMHEALLPGGALLLSGFVVGDRHMLAQGARDAGFELAERLQEGEWALLGVRKKG